MTAKSSIYKREIVNQLISFSWTVLCFTPVLWYWIKEGLNLNFYLSVAAALIVGILPEKILNVLTVSSKRKFYEKLGVKFIRKFVQNGDVARIMSDTRDRFIIRGVSQAQRYLNTIAMYERYHWICFTFFLLTTIYCFYTGDWKPGMLILAANVLYNLTSILLQQYNKTRIRKITRRIA